MKSRFYYKENDRIFYIDDDNDTLQSTSVRALWKNDGYGYYEAFKGFEATVESLIDFRNKFIVWCDEIKPISDYRKYYCNSDAVTLTFKRYATNDLNKLNIDDIDFTECFYMEKCNNGGWIKLMPEFKDQVIESYGYDQTGFYPWLLANSNFKFPIKQGKEYYLDRLPTKNLYYGIYHVTITCDNPEFRKFFIFSKNNYYTHTDVALAQKYKKKYNVTLELNLDCETNCLLYEETDLIDSKVIFKTWFDKLNRAKTLYKKNKVAKHLMSSLWGHLIKFDRMFCEEEEFFNLDMSKINSQSDTEFKLLDVQCFGSGSGVRTRYEYIRSNKPYSHNLARLKPFFTSHARLFMINLVLSEDLLPNLIRTHTDNITLNKPHDFTHLPYHPILEDKTTGLILWKNVNNYQKEDS